MKLWKGYGLVLLKCVAIGAFIFFAHSVEQAKACGMAKENIELEVRGKVNDQKACDTKIKDLEGQLQTKCKTAAHEEHGQRDCIELVSVNSDCRTNDKNEGLTAVVKGLCQVKYEGNFMNRPRNKTPHSGHGGSNKKRGSVKTEPVR
jgi:hypothetical protein